MPKERKSPAFAGLASIDRAYNHCAAGENDLVLLSLLDYHTKSPSPCQGGIFTISLVFSACRHRPAPQASLCKGSWHGVAVTEWLPAKGNNFISPDGGAESPEGDGLYACPAGAYFSMKKSRQKSFRAPP